ncbi:hypothetical protein [Roseicella aerolata]|uniref:Uncharacterized protein n=1 Tax=Roseicella aerolata TaxID=2883479 RepID=A0A9X1IJR5_9PROT|nr:hypothetical protein [Roseicella aerolata]MCB4825434.1 hypothetical protein [Roseicella aerolata]
MGLLCVGEGLGWLPWLPAGACPGPAALLEHQGREAADPAARVNTGVAASASPTLSATICYDRYDRFPPQRRLMIAVHYRSARAEAFWV